MSILAAWGVLHSRALALKITRLLIRAGAQRAARLVLAAEQWLGRR